MSSMLDIQSVRQLLACLGRDMELRSDELRDLDAHMGDGDLGVTMTLGGRALLEASGQVQTDDIGKLLFQCGVRFNQAAASTFGVLFATGLMAAGKTLNGKTAIGFSEMVAAAEAGEAAIMARGKANPGDKTMLDAIHPAIIALQKSRDSGTTMQDGLNAALQAAIEGAESTRAMQSKVGRASWLGDKSVGLADPGAVAISRILESVSRFLSAHSVQ